MDFEFTFPQEIDEMIAELKDGCKIKVEIIPKEEGYKTTGINFEGDGEAIAMAAGVLAADVALSIAARYGSDPMEGWDFIAQIARILIEHNTEEAAGNSAIGRAE